MKIDTLTASFGKFNNESISFHDGLNVIFAPNESGKSTWCAFIKAMLYGVDSSERVKAGYLPDKQHYAPWSGAPMEGIMTLNADRCDITITRTTRNKNAPMQEFSATYTGTVTPVRNMTGSNCGEQLTGVSKDVFCRSAFVSQGAAAVTGSPEMEKRIQSLLSSGEEDTSFSEAEERLLAWQRKRRFNRRGMIPDIDRKIDDTTIQLDNVSQSAEKLSELQEQLEDAQLECLSLETAVTDARKQHRKEIIGGLTEARRQARELAEKQNDALNVLTDLRDEMRRSIFGPRSAEDVEEQAESDMAELERLESSKGKVLSVLPVMICFIFALAGAIVYEKCFHYTAVIAAAGLICLTAMFFLFRYISNRKKTDSANERISVILRSYAADSADEIPDRVDAHHALCNEVKKASEKEKAATLAADEAYRRLNMLEEQATEELDFVSGNSEAARLGNELVRQRTRASKIGMTVAAEESRLALLGDPVVLKGELNRLKDNRSVLQSEYDAIDTALTALREADDEIQSRFSPKLGELAAKYMSFLTGGKYEDILLSKDFSAKAKAKDETVAHDSGYLSAGTSDLLYLAVRLAVCELALPEGEPCPLIIDDALVNLDDERYEQAMKLLGEISKERQVILFTCRQN